MDIKFNVQNAKTNNYRWCKIDVGCQKSTMCLCERHVAPLKRLMSRVHVWRLILFEPRAMAFHLS